ncbi:MAG: hypothetical protein ACJZ85_01485 [Pontiellaceae bacterium]
MKRILLAFFVYCSNSFAGSWVTNQNLGTRQVVAINYDGSSYVTENGSRYNLAMNDSGSIYALGDSQASDNGSWSGKVSIFEDGSLLGNPILGESSSDGAGAYDDGQCVSLDSSGYRVAVGAIQNFGSHNISGHVRVFDFINGDWIQVGQELLPISNYVFFGRNVSLSGDGNRLAVTDSNQWVYTYELINGTWVYYGGSEYGDGLINNYTSCELNYDGTRLVVGNYQSNGLSGAVRVYELSDSGWEQIGSDLTGTGGERFGNKVRISSNGNRIAINAHEADSNGYSNNGAVRVYEYSNNDWFQLGEDLAGSGNDQRAGRYFDFSGDGSTVIVGLLQYGRARVYSYITTVIDSDGDGLSDEDEVDIHLTDPNDADSDNDGLTDGDEVNTYSTDPNDADSDDDDLIDGDEVTNGTSPLIENIKPVSNIESFYESQNEQNIEINAIPTDGYPTNFTYQWIQNDISIPSIFGGTGSSYTIGGSQEYNGNWSVLVSNDTGTTTNTFIFQIFTDLDQDGLSDGRETYVTFTNPNSPDTDNDSITDADEVNIYSTDPNDLDSDDDGFDDGTELFRGLSPTSADTWIVNYILSNRPSFNSISNGMTLNQIKNLRVGSQLFGVSNGNATIRMYVDDSSDLMGNWSNTQHVLEMDMPANEDTMYYRFRMK